MISHCVAPHRKDPTAPTTPHTQRPMTITRTRFRLFHFRSPLLTEYLFLPVLRCFTSRRTHPRTMNSHAGDQTQLWPGSPIRTPSDHHSLASSPRHIAGCNVLLRPFIPRHPPNALKHLQNKKHTPTHNTHGLKRVHRFNVQACKDARVHYTIPKHHTNTPTQPCTTHDHITGGTGTTPKSLTARRVSVTVPQPPTSTTPCDTTKRGPTP